MDIFTKGGLNQDYFNLLALSTNFIKRVRRLSGSDYFYILMFNAANAVMSYNSMAGTFFGDQSRSVNKQALHKAFLKVEFEHFFDHLFNDIFSLKILKEVNKGGYFKRILIQDSTILKIPNSLFDIFSGVSNGSVCVANCRIQLAIDIISNLFTYFSIDSYSQNDLLAVSKLKIRKGDLILRDRGYFLTSGLYKIKKSGAHFISRFYNRVNYYDKQGCPINIIKELRKKRITRLLVRIGDPSNPLVVLHAVKIKEELANERRRKAKNNAHGKRINHKTMLLFSWQIYLTSINDESFSIEEIYSLYSLRWRIEIIFKALKSHCNFACIHPVPERQLKLILKSRILLVVLITHFIYKPIVTQLEKKNLNFQLSYLQLVRHLIKNIQMLEIIFQKTTNRQIDFTDHVITGICKYCRYSSKNKIENFHQNLLYCLS